MQKLSVLLIGAGNMGGALLEGWVRAGILDAQNSGVIDPSPSGNVFSICEERRIPINPLTDRIAFDVCVLAVKPHELSYVVPGLSWPGMDKTAFVSVAAGIPAAEIAMLLKSQTDAPSVVRAMPNLPVAQGQGMTLLASDGPPSDDIRGRVGRLFDAVGGTVWCKTEDDLDRLMGISGCGPAYVYLLCEALEGAAIEQGASSEEARLLAEMTVRGAAAQLAADGRPAAALREAVTSPNGTTAAALDVLEHGAGNIKSLMVAAVAAAYKRSTEMRS